ncbi:MAG TPA: hypothetical protein VKT54_00295 [Steroidobacteraceae bacterium]|nr:hypothetical protein [Steroidobacteraceae bacterium]
MTSSAPSEPSEQDPHIPPAAPLSFWLQLMLAEIASKREALERARAEEALRGSELSRTEP